MGFNPGGGGGGSSSIATATDAALNNPLNNDVLTYDNSVSKWKNATAPAAAVSSVAGKTGAVSLVKGDVGLANVDNTSDVNKPLSTAAQTALASKVETSTLSSSWGVLPTLYYASGAWPSRVVPSGYTGAVVWDSATDVNAPAPTGSVAGDRWVRRTS